MWYNFKIALPLLICLWFGMSLCKEEKRSFNELVNAGCNRLGSPVLDSRIELGSRPQDCGLLREDLESLNGNIQNF